MSMLRVDLSETLEGYVRTFGLMRRGRVNVCDVREGRLSICVD